MGLRVNLKAFFVFFGNLKKEGKYFFLKSWKIVMTFLFVLPPTLGERGPSHNKPKLLEIERNYHVRPTAILPVCPILRIMCVSPVTHDTNI
jgi:hypothetical protein